MFDWSKDNSKIKKKPKCSKKSSNKLILKLRKPNTEKFRKSLAYIDPKKRNLLPEAFHRPFTKHAFKLLVGHRIEAKAKIDTE